MADLMNAQFLLVLGLISGGLSCLAYLPYALDTMAGRTRPQRASWLIWMVLSSISLAAQVYEGAAASLWFSAVQVGWTGLIFALSLRFGVGGLVNLGDTIVLILAGAGLLLWAVAETPAYTMMITIGISLLGGSATIRKAYRDPESETMLAWLLSLVAAGLAVLAAGSLEPLILAYPAYVAVLSAGICAAIFLGRARARRAQAEKDESLVVVWDDAALSAAPRINLAPIEPGRTLVRLEGARLAEVNGTFAPSNIHLVPESKGVRAKPAEPA